MLVGIVIFYIVYRILYYQKSKCDNNSMASDISEIKRMQRYWVLKEYTDDK